MPISQIIMMCAGRAERWKNHRGAPKHLTVVDGEALLDRTIRQLQGASPGAIAIVAFREDYARPGCARVTPCHPADDFCDTDKFLSAETHWSPHGQTVLLYGDVFFTDRAIETIVSHTGPHRFFGRTEYSHYTGRPWRELFAVSFPPEEHGMLRAAMQSVRHALQTGQAPRGGGWELYHHLHGRTGRSFVRIDDFTDDFDFPSDYDTWHRRYSNRVHRALVPIYNRPLKALRYRLRHVLPARRIVMPGST